MTTATAERQNNHDRTRPTDDRRPPTVGQAVRRHWILTTLMPLLLVGLAVAISFQRPPTYTAQVRLNAGPVGPSPQAFSGVAEASQALAGTYARVVDAQAVIKPVGANLGVSPTNVASRIEASPIPESSLIIIEAEGPSERSAVELANLAGDSLIRYVTSLTHQDGEDSARLLEEFTRNSRSLQELAARRARLRKRAEAQPAGADQAQLARVEADVEALQLKLKTLSSLYQTSQQGKAAGSSLRVLSPAAGAESDRIPVLQGLVFLALVAGAAAGVALAVLRSRRGRRQRDGEPGSPGERTPTRTSRAKHGRGGLSIGAVRTLRRTLVALLVVVMLVGGVTAAYFALGEPDLLGIGSPGRPSPRISPPPHDPPTVTVAQDQPEPLNATLQLIPSSAVWVCLVDAADRRLVAGEVLRPGTGVRSYRSRRLRLSLATPDVKMRLNGRRLAVPEVPGPIGYEMTAAGRKRLPADEQPSCRRPRPAASTTSG